MTKRTVAVRSPRRAAAGSGSEPAASEATAAPPRKRLASVERERQIVAGAIRFFFSERGLDGQLRDLAQSIGITHTLLC